MMIIMIMMIIINAKIMMIREGGRVSILRVRVMRRIRFRTMISIRIRIKIGFRIRIRISIRIRRNQNQRSSKEENDSWFLTARVVNYIPLNLGGNLKVENKLFP